MKKNRALLYFSVFVTVIWICIPANAQYKRPTYKGMQSISGDITMSLAMVNRYDVINSYFHLVASPSYNYFLTNRISLGIYMHEEFSTDFQNNLNGFGVGPRLRLYLTNKFFFGISSGFSISKNTEDYLADSKIGYQVNGTMGYTLFLSELTGIEWILDFSHWNRKSMDNGNILAEGYTGNTLLMGAGLVKFF